MSGEDETTCVELTALEQNNESQQMQQINESQQINKSQQINESQQELFATESNTEAGTEKCSEPKWHWVKGRSMRVSTMLDECKNPLCNCLKVALLLAVFVVVLFPSIFYYLPLLVRHLFMMYNVHVYMSRVSYS